LEVLYATADGFEVPEGGAEQGQVTEGAIDSDDEADEY